MIRAALLGLVAAATITRSILSSSFFHKTRGKIESNLVSQLRRDYLVIRSEYVHNLRALFTRARYTRRENIVRVRTTTNSELKEEREKKLSSQDFLEHQLIT